MSRRLLWKRSGKESLARSGIVYIGIGLLLFFALAPFAWIFLTSIKPWGEIYTSPITYLPKEPTFYNYIELSNPRIAPFGRFFMNSVFISTATMLLSTLISLLAGYHLARFKFIGKNTVLVLLLFTQMFPSVLLLAPLLHQWNVLGLVNTYQCLIISNLSFTVPFAVWMLAGYFETIPKELEDSAMVDGCTRFGALVRVVLPLAAPGLAATAIYTYVSSWSELFFAVIFTSSADMRTLSAGLMFMLGQWEIQWGPLCAGSIVGTIPVVILFGFLQKYLIQGLTAGAIKG